MKNRNRYILAILIGIFVAVTANLLTSSNYPPCDLVANGIGVSTYGCSNLPEETHACQNEIANSEGMANCIHANYYKAKTFPFGFKQYFGNTSNLIDIRPLILNATILFFVTTIVILALLDIKGLKTRFLTNKRTKL